MAAIRTTTTTSIGCLLAGAALLCMGGLLLARGVAEYRRAPLIAPMDKHVALAGPQRAVLDAATDGKGLNMAVMADIKAAEGAYISDRPRLFYQARTKQIDALQKNIADPYAWLRMAYLNLVIANDRPAALESIRISQQVAPYEPQLELQRVMAFYELGDLHTADDKMVMRREWQYAFRGDRENLMTMLKSDPQLLPMVDSAMQNDTPDYASWWKSKRAEYGL